MSLQYRFFVIPIKNVHEAEEELNRFLRSVRVITTHREFVAQGENSFWGMAVEHVSDGVVRTGEGENSSASKKKVDYREVLSPEIFPIFAKLRDWRKIAADQEGIPVYTILTNEQLAKIAEKRVITKAALREIEGVGDAGVKKYGDAVIKIVSEFPENKGVANEAQGQSVSSDSNS